jgi:arylsulfatase A-like enzyme
MPDNADADLLTGARSWRLAALPSFAVLGVSLPLAFAGHADQYLYDFRAADLVPLYATAWLILAIVALPAWALLTAALRGLEALHRPPAALILRGVRVLLIAAAAEIVVAALIGSLRIWVGTFGHQLDLPADAAVAISCTAGLLVAGTAHGRAAAKALLPVAIACTVAGALSLATLPMFGWSGKRLEKPPAVASAARGGASSPPAPVPTSLTSRSVTSTGGVAGAARPNIIMLTMDALSAQHMSLYGYYRPTTPNLTGFAQSAITFDRAYANANYTTPGVSSILTGTRPWTHRALQLPTWPLAATRRNSLPAVLMRAGYRMGYVSTNPHAGPGTLGLGGYFQFARTDRVSDRTLCTDWLSAHLPFVCAAAELPPLQTLQRLATDFRSQPAGNREQDPRLAIDPALAWLETVDRNKPIFLWVHLLPPHTPYAAPPPWLGRFDPSSRDVDAAHTQPEWAWQLSRLSEAHVRTLEARYDESVLYEDYYAGKFLRRALETLGPNTAVVVSADHGESFHHGYGAHTGPGLYDEIIHIPLIIKLPGETTGERCDALAQQVDIAPTLAAIAGVGAPGSWEGHALLGACRDGQPGEPQAYDPAFSMNFEQNPRFAKLKTGSVAVIDGNWKLIRYMGVLHYPFMAPLHDQLYNIAADPGERDNLAAQDPGIVQRLQDLIDQQLAKHGGPVRRERPAPQVPIQSAAVR